MNDIGLSVVADIGFGRASVARDTSTVGVGSQPPKAAETGKTLPGDLAASAQKQSVQQLGQAVKELNQFVQNEQRDLKFQINEDTGEMVVRVVDRSSGELIRQIPNEVVIALAAQVRNNEPLQLLDMQG
jgi:flagellar protein FlaG